MRNCIVVACLIALSGCKSSPSLVGKWTAELPELTKVVIQMDADGTATLNGEYSGVKIEIIGDYKLEGDRLVLKSDTVRILSDIPAMLKPLADSQADKIRGQEAVGKVVWKGSDQVLFTPETNIESNPLSRTMTLNRIKP